MNILITWITWFIWKSLAERLQDTWYNIFWIIRESSQTQELDGNNISFFKYTWKNDEELKNYIQNNEITWVIHLATTYVINHSTSEINTLIDSNITFWTKVLEIASSTWVKWFLNTSSFIQHYEEVAYSPQNLYAATKQAFEDIGKYYNDSWKIWFFSLSLVNTYGPWDTRKKVFNIWNQYSQNNATLESTSGEQYIDILYIDDVIDAYILLILKTLDNSFLPYGKKYAISSWQKITLKNLADIFQEVSKKKLSIAWWAIPHRDREIMTPYNVWLPVPNWEAKTTIHDWIKNFIKNDSH